MSRAGWNTIKPLAEVKGDLAVETDGSTRNGSGGKLELFFPFPFAATQAVVDYINMVAIHFHR